MKLNYVLLFGLFNLKWNGPFNTIPVFNYLPPLEEVFFFYSSSKQKFLQIWEVYDEITLVCIIMSIKLFIYPFNPNLTSLIAGVDVSLLVLIKVFPSTGRTVG